MAQQPPQWNGTPNDQTTPSYPSYQSPHSPQHPRQRPPTWSNKQTMSQQTANWWQRFTAWFGRQSRSMQVGTGCAGLLVACIVCSCVGTALGAGGGGGSTTGTISTGAGNTSSNPPIVQATTTDAPTMAAATATATATPKPKPKPKPTNTPVPPAPKPTCIPGAVNCNPWGYNFTPGNLIYNPPSAFCSYFACINNFWNGRGYVMQCQDGMFSKSGGISGSCSYHKGNKQPLYSH